MSQGKIKRIVSDRGFGFIERDGEKDLFFHASGVLDRLFDSLQEGDDVDYEVVDGDKGQRAAKVRRV